MTLLLGDDRSEVLRLEAHLFHLLIYQSTLQVKYCWLAHTHEKALLLVHIFTCQMKQLLSYTFKPFHSIQHISSATRTNTSTVIGRTRLSLYIFRMPSRFSEVLFLLCVFCMCIFFRKILISRSGHRKIHYTSCVQV